MEASPLRILKTRLESFEGPLETLPAETLYPLPVPLLWCAVPTPAFFCCVGRSL